jgi:predicted RND superfamily exporter protein
MISFARWMVRRPIWCLAANGALTVLLGWFALGIRVESSLSSVLPAGDPQIEYYAKVRETFGSDDVGVVGVRADDIFAASTMTKIARVTEAIAKVKGVQTVLSITNAPDIAEDVVNHPPLLPHIPPSKTELDTLKAKLKAIPLYGKNLVAEDFKGAAINVFFKNLTDVEYYDLGVDRNIRKILDAEQGLESFYFTGAAHLTQAALELMRRDLQVFTPIALVLVLIAFGVSFLSLRGVVLPAVSVLMAVSWTLGVMVLGHKSITLGTFVLPPLLLVVGSSYAIHVMARYYEQVDAGAPREELVVRAFERVWQPLIISALTTVVGFGSLMVNRITAIWDLGLFAVIGIVFLTITSLTVIPPALELMPLEQRTRRSGKISPMLSDALTRLGKRDFIFRDPILWISGALAAVALIGSYFIQVDSNFLYYFKPTSPIRSDNEIINQTIAGSNPFYLVVEGNEAGVMKRWEVLKQVKELQNFLLTLPGITSSLSLVDYLELFEAGLTPKGAEDVSLDEQGNPLPPEEKPKSFWEEPKNLAGLLQFVQNNAKDVVKSVVTSDYRSGSILVRTKLTGSREIEATLQGIRDYVEQQFPPKLKVTPTGNLVLLTGTASDIVAGQIKSLSLALGVIFVVMSLMFLSLKVGLLAILPNALPILIFFGVMGWFGIFLNLGTSLIAAIALGIAVDSTIHYMSRLNLELKGAVDQVSALVGTLRIVGAPIIYATVALFLGFLTFAFSSFVPIQQFGVLSGVTMATALVTNLVLLPALLATTKIITVWDLLAVKIGEDPARTIPLFAGLRPAQARIVVLMGEIKHFDPGEPIIRTGEIGDEMYVIISGGVDVIAGTGAERRRIAQHKRGDVFGEMGLVRRHERTADVIAAEPVELLAVNERFLQRIQFRYPRIASKVFLNLTRIVSDRLQRMTEQYVAVQTSAS